MFPIHDLPKDIKYYVCLSVSWVYGWPFANWKFFCYKNNGSIFFRWVKIYLKRWNMTFIHGKQFRSNDRNGCFGNSLFDGPNFSVNFQLFHALSQIQLCDM